MASQAAGTSTKYDRILNALSTKVLDEDRGEKVLPAYTLDALAEAADVNHSAVALALALLINAGKVRTRKHRSGVTLYKLSTDNDRAWDAFRGGQRH